MTRFLVFRVEKIYIDREVAPNFIKTKLAFKFTDIIKYRVALSNLFRIKIPVVAAICQKRKITRTSISIIVVDLKIWTATHKIFIKTTWYAVIYFCFEFKLQNIGHIKPSD